MKETFTEDAIEAKASAYMASGRTIGGGDAGWIKAAYKDGIRDLLNTSEWISPMQPFKLREEPKRETLEEAKRAYLNKCIREQRLTGYCDEDFENGVKWHAEQYKKMYSEEEVEDLIYKVCGTVARLQGITLDGNHIVTAYNKFKKK